MEHGGHRERLRKRFEQEGLDHFELHNLIELLLFTIIPRRDTNGIAHRLVDRFHSLPGILDAPIDELCRVDGIGEQTAVFLHMIPQLARLYLSESVHPTDAPILSLEDAAEFINLRMLGYDHEVVFAMLLTNTGYVRFSDVIVHGSLSSAQFSTRELLSICTKYRCNLIVLAHNHPDGSVRPSADDIMATAKIIQALEFSGVQLMDHIITANGVYTSFRQSGYMKDAQRYADRLTGQKSNAKEHTP